MSFLLLNPRQYVLELRVVHFYAVVQVYLYHLIGQVVHLLLEGHGFGQLVGQLLLLLGDARLLGAGGLALGLLQVR